MSRPWPGLKVISVRSMISVLALAATLALGTHVLFSAGGLLDKRTPISSAEAQNLVAPQTRPIHQAASVACFRNASAVVAVRASGKDAYIQFTGQSRLMRIQYLKDDRAAIRYAYSHPDPLPNNFYDNTNWFNTPTHLTHSDLNALAACLPQPR